MEKQASKGASGSKRKSKDEAKPWRCEKNRLLYERNKQELIFTESEEDELGSDLEEILWTYNEDPLFEEYEDALQIGTKEDVQKAAAKYIAHVVEQHKKLEAKASEASPSSK
jgi:predicted Zn-dependent peptidase